MKTNCVAIGWAAVIGTGGCVSMPAAAATTPVETIVLVRHGEKPREGLGLLTCQGLNRALALPEFFADNFQPPDYIFAPDPSVKATEIHGDGQRYDYVRPLLTIGPTAIRLGIPINTQLPFNDPGLLADTLMESRYHTSTIYVAWEHLNIVTFAEILLNRFDSETTVPEWSNEDYDKVFVFRIGWDAPHSLEFEVMSEKIGSVSRECPDPVR